MNARFAKSWRRVNGEPVAVRVLCGRQTCSGVLAVLSVDRETPYFFLNGMEFEKGAWRRTEKALTPFRPLTDKGKLHLAKHRTQTRQRRQEMESRKVELPISPPPKVTCPRCSWASDLVADEALASRASGKARYT